MEYDVADGEVIDAPSGGSLPTGWQPVPGIHDGVPEEEYHAAPGVSVSTLKRFAEAPLKAITPRKETSSLRFGTLTHTAILQPELLADRYFVTDLKRLAATDKAFKDEQAKAGQRELVKRADWDAAMRMSDAVRSHPIARDFLATGLEIEQSICWEDEETGLLCRGRVDGLRRDMRALVDLKSTEGAGPEKFAKAIAEYKYHWQSPFYLDGVATAPGGFIPETFVFLAVEKEAPFLVGAYEIEPRAIEIGREQVREQMRGYAECMRTGVWPGYSDTLEMLVLPPWAYART